jgi:hypothetical protein
MYAEYFACPRETVCSNSTLFDNISCPSFSTFNIKFRERSFASYFFYYTLNCKTLRNNLLLRNVDFILFYIFHPR